MRFQAGCDWFLHGQIVRNVGEPCLTRADALRPLQRLLQRGVAGVGFVAQRRQREHFDTLRSAKLSSGIALTSVRYAALPKRNPAICCSPCKQRDANKFHAMDLVAFGQRLIAAPARASDMWRCGESV